MSMDRIFVFMIISALLLLLGVAGFILVSRHELLQHAQTIEVEH